MTKKRLTTITGTEIIIRQRKTTVLIELVHNDPNETSYTLQFTPEGYVDAMDTIKAAAHQAWPNIKPKKYTSVSSHYHGYFDEELSGYGFLIIGTSDQIAITKPDGQNKRMYQFNKRRMESFLFDYEIIKQLKSIET